MATEKIKYVIMTSAVSNLNTANLIIYIYSSNFFLIIPLTENLLFCNIRTNDIKLHTPIKTIPNPANNAEVNISRLFSKLNKIVFSWNSYFFKKLVLDGKAYRISKFRKSNFNLMLGQSNRCTLITNGVFLRKKIKIKKKFMFYGTKPSYVLKASVISKKVRPNDIYTLRGIRWAKDLSVKKLGKKGSSSIV